MQCDYCRDAARLAYYRQVRGYIKAKVAPAIEALRDTPEGVPEHLTKVLAMMREYEGDAAPEGAQLEAFLSAPKHHLARLIRDLFSGDAAATTMQVGGVACIDPLADDAWALSHWWYMGQLYAQSRVPQHMRLKEHMRGREAVQRIWIKEVCMTQIDANPRVLRVLYGSYCIRGGRGVTGAAACVRAEPDPGHCAARGARPAVRGRPAHAGLCAAPHQPPAGHRLREPGPDGVQRRRGRRRHRRLHAPGQQAPADSAVYVQPMQAPPLQAAHVPAPLYCSAELLLNSN